MPAAKEGRRAGNTRGKKIPKMKEEIPDPSTDRKGSLARQVGGKGDRRKAAEKEYEEERRG